MPFQPNQPMMMAQPQQPIYQPAPQQPRPQAFQPVPQQPRPQPQFVAAPLSPQPVKGSQTPTNSEQAQQYLPKPFVRLQDPGPATLPTSGGRLVMPPPEHFGLATPVAQALAPAPVEAVDWNQVRARLQKVGSVGFHLDKVGQGHRFIVYLPNPVEAVAESEGAAIHQALAQAEAMVLAKR